jgi:hypothetical protein
MSSILRGKMPIKAFASRSWTYERSSLETCGDTGRRRGYHRKHWHMRPVLTERISVPSSEPPTVPALPWSLGSQRSWVWKLQSCFNDHQRWGEARANCWFDPSTKVLPANPSLLQPGCWTGQPRPTPPLPGDEQRAVPPLETLSRVPPPIPFLAGALVALIERLQFATTFRHMGEPRHGAGERAGHHHLPAFNQTEQRDGSTSGFHNG